MSSPKIVRVKKGSKDSLKRQELGTKLGLSKTDPNSGLKEEKIPKTERMAHQIHFQNQEEPLLSPKRSSNETKSLPKLPLKDHESSKDAKASPKRSISEKTQNKWQLNTSKSEIKKKETKRKNPFSSSKEKEKQIEKKREIERDFFLNQGSPSITSEFSCSTVRTIDTKSEDASPLSSPTFSSEEQLSPTSKEEAFLYMTPVVTDEGVIEVPNSRSSYRTPFYLTESSAEVCFFPIFFFFLIWCVFFFFDLCVFFWCAFIHIFFFQRSLMQEFYIFMRNQILMYPHMGLEEVCLFIFPITQPLINKPKLSLLSFLFLFSQRVFFFCWFSFVQLFLSGMAGGGAKAAEVTDYGKIHVHEFKTTLCLSFYKKKRGTRRRGCWCFGERKGSSPTKEEEGERD